MSRKLLAATPFIVASCLQLAGCSGSDRPSIAPVQGKVMYQGKAVAGATVAFLCPGAPRLAIGTTDEAGNYRLTTFEPNDGAVIGTHIVTVNLFLSEDDLPAANAATDSKAMSKAIDEAMRTTVSDIENAEKVKPLLPTKYSDRKTSDLHKDVLDEENVIDIELTD